MLLVDFFQKIWNIMVINQYIDQYIVEALKFGRKNSGIQERQEI